ncbi:hypothetical protein GCM10023335_88020 [Streptomyces siamensis]|uniref:Uncharacterized protein n=1 Tax=Streptomyces siamensis TaxID=1274986 RepID=A0ABP9JP99_9ACTN
MRTPAIRADMRMGTPALGGRGSCVLGAEHRTRPVYGRGPGPPHPSARRSALLFPTLDHSPRTRTPADDGTHLRPDDGTHLRPDDGTHLRPGGGTRPGRVAAHNPARRPHPARHGTERARRSVERRALALKTAGR